MTSAYEAQFKAQTLAQQNAKPASGRTVPPTDLRSPAGLKMIGKETPKEQPGPKPDAPLRWQQAGPLFAEQFPGEFALRVTGPATLLPALVKALEELASAAIVHHIGY